MSDRNRYEQLNKDYRLRDKILAPYFKAHDIRSKARHGPCLDDTDFWTGGVRHFTAMPVEALKSLVTHGFAYSDERQNGSPTIESFITFMGRWPHFVFAHGYAVSHDRDDYRVSIEGVEGHLRIPDEMDKESQEEKMKFEKEFLTFFEGADELELNNNGYFRVWYD